jgi:hypothetical protein
MGVIIKTKKKKKCYPGRSKLTTIEMCRSRTAELCDAEYFTYFFFVPFMSTPDIFLWLIVSDRTV